MINSVTPSARSPTRSGRSAGRPRHLLLERDASMVAATRGIERGRLLRAPRAGLPLLERLKIVIEDAACKACVTQAPLRAGVLATFFSDLERPRKLVNVVELDVLDPFNSPDRPLKGVGAPRACLQTAPPRLRLLRPARPENRKASWSSTAVWYGASPGLQRRYPLTVSDVMLLKTTYTFGISEWELFWAPTVGACTLVSGAQDHKDASVIASLLQKCTVCCFVPSALAATAERSSNTDKESTSNVVFRAARPYPLQ